MADERIEKQKVQEITDKHINCCDNCYVYY